MKKRVLFCGEASFLSTGYGTYELEVLKRLHATGKYELCELSAYALQKDPRVAGLPWRFISAMPDMDDEAQAHEYHRVATHQFGEMMFEKACISFRPDIVLDIRDWWMLEFEERSPFRPYYHWAIMPTVDAAPQEEQWISTFCGADAVFTYSDFGLETLKKQSQNSIKTKCSAPPGADLNSYHVVKDKREHRRKIGVDEDSLIIGTVMRNQKRKLYPDLIESFAKYLTVAPAEMAKKSYLYLHACWPDLGWDIPRLIKEAGVGNRVLMTYICESCGGVFPNYFQDCRTHCRSCGKLTAIFPHSSFGVSRQVLGQILSLFDVYVQYANSEGFGMPQVEAAACGIPVMAVDYSAMSDVVRKVRGTPIAVQRYERENETHCYRAIPDNDDFIRKTIQFLSLPEPVRLKKGWEARKGVERHYNWDRTAKIWEDHLDSVECKPQEQTWLGPARCHEPVTQIPEGLSNEEFVRWGICHIAGRPDLANSYMALRMIRDLNWGKCLPTMAGAYHNEASMLNTRQRFEDFNRDKAARVLLNMCGQRNHWERERTAKNG